MIIKDQQGDYNGVLTRMQFKSLFIYSPVSTQRSIVTRMREVKRKRGKSRVFSKKLVWAEQRQNLKPCKETLPCNPSPLA